MTRETDQTLRRIERDSWIAYIAMAVAVMAISGRVDVALGIAAGGALAALSYGAIKHGANALAAAVTRTPAEAASRSSYRRRIAARGAIVFIGRYALLAFLAYVMIARLRLHPIGLLVGASSIVLAVAVEALRLLLTRPMLKPRAGARRRRGA